MFRSDEALPGSNPVLSHQWTLGGVRGKYPLRSLRGPVLSAIPVFRRQSPFFENVRHRRAVLSRDSKGNVTAGRLGARRRWHSPFPSLGESHREAAVEAGAIFAFNRKKFSGSYFALMVARRAMFAPYALAANAPAVSSAWPVKFV
jgi:hypothetical protein